MAVKSVNDIPTLTQLYRDPESVLSAAISKGDTRLPPNNAINERIGLIRGDITKLRLDAVLNAAKRSLLGGGGIDGAIHAAAGKGLLAECRPLGPINTGEAVITKGYNLPAKYVIHTVGPIYGHESKPDEKLAMCYRESLKVAVENGVETIGLCGVSTGIYGYPHDVAAQIACKTVREFLETEEGEKLSRVVFVTFTSADVKSYNETIPIVFPPVKGEVTE
ncbi:rna-directed rna polymerase [Fusarium longipes]|uniref:Rna-directed rna polymerase n=1 Tax=Fusarium longipes TaxID=694270 RepID=A0A395T7J8_9HYPO|nr:rna-directed rna polymerase [Fusarium longipes]